MSVLLPPGLDDRLAALERRLAALEDDSGVVADNIAYHGQTVDVTGEVFSAGVQLRAVPVGQPGRPNNEVSWIAGDGTPLASWQTLEDGAILSGSALGQVVETIYDGAGNPLAQLVVDPNLSSLGVQGNEIQVDGFAVSVNVQGATYTLLNVNDESSFLRIPLAELALDIGSTVLHFHNTSAISDTATVVHQLGRTPLAVAALPYQAFPIPALTYAGGDATTFQLAGQMQAPVNADITVAWIAIG